MSQRQAVRYKPAPQERVGTQVSYPYLVPSPASGGVGQEAAEVTWLMEELTNKINMTETAMRMLLSRMERTPTDYKHVEPREVGVLSVRYRYTGRLGAREVPIDDE